MNPARKTWTLAAVSVLLVLVNLAGGASAQVEALPVLPPVAPESVTRVILSTPVERMVMERVVGDKARPELDKWRITTPLDFPADSAQVRSLLRAFGAGVEMDAKVDDGNLEDYAVDDQHGRLVELFTDGAEPAVSVVVGKPAAGSSSFVRIPGSDAVYRADVGGRSRYDKPSAEWRDKVAFELDADSIQSVELARGSERLRFRRGPGRPVGTEGKEIPGDWEMVDPPFPVDETAIAGVVRALTRIRAGEVHHAGFEGGFERPLAEATLLSEDGTTHRIRLGSRSDTRAGYLQVEGREEVFQVSGQVTRQLTQPVSALRDRAVFTLLRRDVASVALAEGGLTVVLAAADEGGETWAITQPPNMETDQRQALYTVNTLVSLRAHGIATDPTFHATGGRFLITERDGTTRTIEIGQAETDPEGQKLVRARVSGSDTVYLLKATTLAELRKAFGR